MRWMHGLRARLRLLHRGAAEARMDEEMALHLEMETERLVAEGYAPEEARRRAVLAFGGVEGHREAMREGRTLAGLESLSLDLRLGVRMMRKSPGLSAVGVFAIAVGVAFGALGYELMSQMLETDLPLEEGDRVVALQLATDNPGNPERRVLRDFAAWREELTTVREVGAFHGTAMRLEGGEAAPAPVNVAVITAAGFTVPRVAPVLGRPLLPADEAPGGPAVMVIGHEAWQSRFGGDPGVVGRTVQLGAEPVTIVGVMPEGYRFPINHQYWIPLRVDPAALAPREGPAVHVFGRLAPGVSMAEAQAELAVVGRRVAAEGAEAGRQLRPQVVRYAHEHYDVDHPVFRWFLQLVRILMGALLVVVAVNLAILVYARTVARVGELAVRSALGASRGRILGQLFLESLALSLTGALIGVGVAAVALRWVRATVGITDELPFWTELELSLGTVGYALALAAVAAAIMGVLPGLRVTGPRLASRLRELGGGTGPRLGRLWTLLIVAQVGIAVAILPLAVHIAARALRTDGADPGYPPEAFAVGVYSYPEGTTLPPRDAWVGSPEAERYATLQRELLRTLRQEPGVVAAVLSTGIPGVQGPVRRVELDAGPASGAAAERAAEPVHAEHAFFAAYDAAILAGRGLRADDASGVVVVNRTWVRHFLGDAPALGRRFRYVAYRTADGEPPAPEPWHEIVGVVEDFPATSLGLAALADGEATVYHPLDPGAVHPVTLTVRYAGALPAGATERIREIGSAIDPRMHVGARPLREQYASLRAGPRWVAVQLAAFTAAVLLLSGAGIYALMSFTVTRRTREIGIRAALGADARRILGSVFARAAGQLALGIAAGAALGAMVVRGTGYGAGHLSPLLLATAAIILTVGALATLGPARRGLRIQPSEALREG